MNPKIKITWKLSGELEDVLLIYKSGIEATLVAAHRTMDLLRERNFRLLADWLNALKDDRRQIVDELRRRKARRPL